MSIFTFTCKYDTIGAFLADKRYSTFIMNQPWFQANKHVECRQKIEEYKLESKKREDEYKLEEEQLLALRQKHFPQKKKKYAFQIRDNIRQSFRDESNRSDALINRFRKKQSSYFNEYITEELIAEALHPRRLLSKMNHFDDIENFFEVI